MMYLYKIQDNRVSVIIIYISLLTLILDKKCLAQRGGYVRFADNPESINVPPQSTRLRTGQSRENNATRNPVLHPVRIAENRRSTRDNQQPGTVVTGLVSKIDASQVADWPFFKSFQSAKSNADRIRDYYEPVLEPERLHGPQTGSTVRNSMMMRPEQKFARLSSERVSSSSQDPIPATKPMEETSTQPGTTTTTSSPSIPTTSTTPSTTTPMSSTMGPEAISTEPALISGEPTTTYSSIDSIPTTELPTSTTATPQKSSTTMNPLFSQKFHSSVQEAVDRIIKMTAETMAKTNKESSPRPTPTKPLSSDQDPDIKKTLSTGSRTSSLSLNVLLKNFGSHNLTNLDQILLKSSHKDNPQTNRTTPLANNDQSLHITGIGRFPEPKSDNKNDNQPEEPMDTEVAAECKIEYTMKHVNISSTNGGRGDYTCDYVIDRKIPMPDSHPEGSMKANRLDITKVCHLQIKSEFFSNEAERDVNCSGTYLAIGGHQFCRLENGAGLDRKFDFPIEKQAFELKMVHKETKGDEETDIYLEIRPLTEENCKRGTSLNDAGSISSSKVEYAPDASSTTSKPSTVTPKLVNRQQPSDQSAIVDRYSTKPIALEGRRQMVTITNPVSSVTVNNHAQTRRKFVVKFPNENQLHPLNNRFKVSQTFDIGSTPNRNHLFNSNDLSSHLQAVSKPEEPELCDNLKHISTVGQLSSAEYPNYYSANINCSFIIKRASRAYCSILLHFRDFDLTNSASSESNCLDDYLQIGQTRYCNKYEMIGHKMKLNFQITTNPDSPSLQVHFHSDHSRSGRGFLIKYHQVLCDSESRGPQRQSEDLSRRSQRTHPSDQTSQTSTRQTVAPPMQQPDFTLRAGRPISSKNLTGPQPMSTSASTVSGSLLTKSPGSPSRITYDTLLQPGRHTDQQKPFSVSQDCNQVNSESSFLLRSPGYPEPYPGGLECLYYVRRNSSQVCYVELTFLKFDLEADAECRYDYIEINNVRLCGSLRDLAYKTTRIYFFNEPIKMIKFKSDNTESRDGFVLRVEQLECGADGAILRQGKSTNVDSDEALVPKSKGAQNGQEVTNVVKATSTNSSRTIEYDSINTQQWQSIPRLRASIRPSPPANGSQISVPNSLAAFSSPALFNATISSKSRPCDEVFYGKEVTIKSPRWPESYSDDDSIAICRYTIMRNIIGKNKICQLELRFVNLRLGVGDCIDVDGYEVLCGFNTRNMVKYYPFDRQSHLTISFFTGTAKFGRSDASDPSDLLPSRGPQRFMILAKQHECIDGFLAPQIEDIPVGSFNQTNLLYSAPSPSTGLRYVNRTGERELSSVTDSQRSISRKRISSSESSPSVGDALLRYDFSNVIMPLTQAQPPRPIPIRANTLQRVKTDLTPGLDNTKLIDRISLTRIPSPTRASTIDTENQCQFNFAQYNGILSSSTILSKLKTQYPGSSDCTFKIKLLPGFCQLQLTFGEFDLIPKLGSGYCLEYLELDGVKYCGNELKNASRILPISDPMNRTVNIRYEPAIGSNIYGFRSIFKQLECEPESLKPIRGSPIPTRTSSNDQQSSNNKLNLINSRSSPTAETNGIEPSRPGDSEQRVDFREIVLRNEFFELNSNKISKAANIYDPSMFVVYRIKKNSPDVCKLRLLFYKFDLEQSPGCKRDFIDINNVDRLCGQLSKPEETRRDYVWQAERDFLISFVSDSNIQREGFLLFGQQHSSGCNETKATTSSIETPVHQMSPTFDEEPHQQTQVQNANQPQKEPDTHPGVRELPNRRPVNETSNSMMPTNDAACYQLFDKPKFEISSPNWPKRYNPETVCYFLIHKSSSNICRVQFNILSMILGPDEMNHSSRCKPASDDTIEIDGQLFCGLIDKPRSISVVLGQRQFISFKFSSVNARGFGFFIEGKQLRCDQEDQISAEKVDYKAENIPLSGSQELRASGLETKQPQGCNQLLSEDLNIIESEEFPQPYKHNQDCIYALRRTNQSTCAIDIVMNHFELEDQNPTVGLCENDYLEIDYSRFCGSYPANHRLRFNYFQDELDKIIKFHTDASVARSGFSLTIKQVSDCETSAGHQATFVPSTRIRDKGSNSDEEIINYLPDSSPNLTSVSSNDTSIHQKTQTLARVSHNSDLDKFASLNDTGKEVTTLCQFVYHNERQFLVSPNYNEHKHIYDNNIDCLYKIVAKSYDYCSLKLTILDLDLEKSSECHNDYLLIDNQRYCDKSSTASNESAPALEVQFADSLPREIHLLYHTDGHHNNGRGFKILYEQRLCNQLGEQDFRLQNGDMRLDHPIEITTNSPSSGQEERIARRLRFGQLSYPRNYVTNSEQHNDRHSSNNHQQQSRAREQKSSWSNSNYKPELAPHKLVTRDPDETELQPEDFTIKKQIMVAKDSNQSPINVANN